MVVLVVYFVFVFVFVFVVFLSFCRSISSPPLPFAMDRLDELVGLVNIVHIATAAALGYYVDYKIFVAMTSWVHYCKYIYQYYWRTARTLPKYAAWKRDVLLFKVGQGT